jgi:hypothetical protein
MRSLAVLETPAGSFSLNDEDLLMAAKLIHYEGGAQDPIQARAIVWTVATRLGWLRRSYTSFAKLVEDFAQPLNPKWRIGGEFCRVGSRYIGTDHCSAQRLTRRAEAAAARWEDLSTTARETALAFVRGELPNPVPGAANFASSTTAEGAVARGEQVLARIGGQTYFAEASSGYTTDSPAWRAVSVRALQDPGSGPQLGLGLFKGLLFAAAAGGLTYGAYRLYRHYR